MLSISNWARVVFVPAEPFGFLPEPTYRTAVLLGLAPVSVSSCVGDQTVGSCVGSEAQLWHRVHPNGRDSARSRRERLGGRKVPRNEGEGKKGKGFSNAQPVPYEHVQPIQRPDRMREPNDSQGSGARKDAEQKLGDRDSKTDRAGERTPEEGNPACNLTSDLGRREGHIGDRSPSLQHRPNWRSPHLREPLSKQRCK
ncbi:hypothetical protein CDEST_06385 [Colletotrichum destructivum]|uniref:Uncharacterized protein n=1 Tax=Colletotrichum destructivum TaxID=34406 RepID=A0AAX4IEC5_9PEZI|nr:hypothetical protein CDEST_06385 [Colletotrichum destructivum]